MKILYGVQATGNGHISRSRVIAHYLNKEEVDVTFLFSGRDKEQLFDMDVFGNYLHRKGLTFVTENGKVNQLKTAMSNNIFKLIKDIYQLDLSAYDLIISDFEPITAWAAKLKNKSSLGIGHQYAFTENTPHEVGHYFEKLIMKLFAPVKYQAGLHWHPFNKTILPPIIDSQLQPKAKKEIYVVYLPFEDQHRVTQLLNKFNDDQFVQYSPELEDKQVANVRLRKTCHSGFKTDLCQAKGVICNAGFELISECLHLGLPIFAKPLSGQIEQLSNAKALLQLGYAQTSQQLDEYQLQHWLSQHQRIENKAMPNVAEAVVEWVLMGKWHDTPSLAHTLWQQASWHANKADKV